MFNLDVGNRIHDIVFTQVPGNEGQWASEFLSDQGYIAMSNSSLTAMYNQCTLCANTTIIAFQNTNGYVQFGNRTTYGWNLTQLSVALDPQIGTGLALQPFYRQGTADQINMYYQKSYDNMSLASWKPAMPSESNEGEFFCPCYPLLILK